MIYHIRFYIFIITKKHCVDRLRPTAQAEQHCASIQTQVHAYTVKDRSSLVPANKVTASGTLKCMYGLLL